MGGLWVGTRGVGMWLEMTAGRPLAGRDAAAGPVRGAGVSLCQGDITSFVGLHVVNGFFTHSLPGFFPFFDSLLLHMPTLACRINCGEDPASLESADWAPPKNICLLWRSFGVFCRFIRQKRLIERFLRLK